MSLGEQNNYYDVLDLTPGASEKEIKDAYLRAKTTYNKDSVALYTLVSPEEREEILEQIEEAYGVLSNNERRKDYDRCHGLLVMDDSHLNEGVANDIVSIDRVPPMEVLTSEDILIPPATDFIENSAFSESSGPSTRMEPVSRESTAAHERARTPQDVQSSQTPVIEPVSAEELAREIEWRGSLLRRIRESRRISVEEMSTATKISKSYLVAIEAENFAKLPAAVFLRGFVTQISKILRLPPERVAPAYLARYYLSRPDQHS
ncbi:MAG TPA: helix-turn-helix domain-containing protein [Bdellovibrionota bacterium]|nr:helix-turn-helix domain-containing protein [Bdellovibrionota bacterium]